MNVARAESGYDRVFRDGLIDDGSGAKPLVGEVALHGDHIAAAGNRQKGSC
jgi:N-acyl-D-aspartate/D-glutamate deacylase